MSATKRFQSWLVKARSKAGLSYGQLAEKSGVSGGAIHSIEHGGGSPSLDTADKLAKALGTHLEYAVRTRSGKAPAINLLDTTKWKSRPTTAAEREAADASDAAADA